MEKKRSVFTAIGLPQNSSLSHTSKSSSFYNTHAKPSEKVPDKLTEEPPGNPSRLKKQQEKTKKAKGDCNLTPSSSGTQFFKKGSHRKSYVRITTDEYFGQSESISGSSQTFHCIHGPEGKLYTEKALLKRNLLKELDPIASDPDWNDKCPNAYGWGLAQKLEFLITDSVGANQFQRLEAHLRDFAQLSSNGYKVHVLDSVCVIVDYLVETLHLQTPPNRREALIRLLVNMSKPILLNGEFDCVTYFENIRSYMGFMGYLLMRMEDDSMFSLVSDAIIWQLSAPDRARGLGAVRRRHVLPAAAPVLHQTTVRMLAVTDAHRFPTFLEVALLLALDSADSCTEMMKENIIENLFYRFNPYFPDRRLPFYDINPADPQDCNVKLGDSGVNLPTVLSLLLVLLRTTKDNIEKDPNFRTILPHPDDYSQRCFVWAYRYECRARGHQHERITMTALVAAMLHVYGNRLTVFSIYLMPDLMSLSVLTELPSRTDWIKSVNFNTGQVDVHFKKMLIKLCVEFVKVFPINHFIVESRYWLLGLMYLVDPGLCYLRARWSPALFAELRRIALQAMVCVLPLTPPRLAVEYGLTRRIMWYIEWYSESPFELPVLYWCLRLLQEIVSNRDTSATQTCLTDLFDTHGIIIIIHLCYTLLDQKMPPIEKAQAVISLNLRLLTSAVDDNRRLVCCVYPAIKWPSSINSLVKKMVESVLYSLDKHLIVSDRWLVSLMNFIWEGVIWNPSYREQFIADNGIFKLLDLITMSRAPVQCIALAMVCDVARDGGAVGQLISWRANTGATRARPNLVKRGATIAALLAAIFRDELVKTGVSLDENGIIQDLECPIMSTELRKAIYHEDFKTPKSQRSTVCLSAGDLAGSRLSKAFALLHLLSDDLEYMVNLADESYNMYKNIKLSPEDESVLVICSNYMTLKLNEVWVETHIQSPVLEPQDHDTLQEFLHIGNGWAKAVKRQQEDVIENDKKKGSYEESSFYTFMARVRLNIALDALREVRCGARSADRARITNALIHDAVLAHHRRSVYVKKLEAPVLRTYGPKLDDQNMTGQNVKVNSIFPRSKPKPKNNLLSPSNVITME